MMETLAGAFVNSDENHIVRYDSETGEKQVLKINGRWVYIKSCILPEISGNIYVPEKSRKMFPVNWVMAFGEDCGKTHKLSAHEKRIPWMTASCEKLNIGDKISTPDDDYAGGIKRSPYAVDEFFVHECLIKCVYGVLI